MFLLGRVSIILHYFVLLVGYGQVNMLSYADAACMTIAVALFLKHVA
jgi:hypothetical protein